MAGTGPAPNPNARRRNVRPSNAVLPSEGRTGKTPEWPLPPTRKHEVNEGLADLELALWTELWSTPQAVAWERLRWVRDVAQYVRWKVQGELGDLEASKEARQLSDRLGLTPLAMLRLGWTISTDEVAEKRSTTPVPKRRLRAVDPSGVAGA